MDIKVRALDSICNTYHYGYSFTGSTGLALVSKSTADLVTDSCYQLQAEKEIDENWDWITVSVFTLRLKKLAMITKRRKPSLVVPTHHRPPQRPPALLVPK